MAEEARVTIPGYQPVAGLGKTPSFGLWVRAIQTRLERHVLLKILPLSATETQVYFDREIAALVRLDGNGVLRVIDEGSAAPVRYLVVDEAGATPLWESRPSADDWVQVCGALEDLFERATAAGVTLLPIPVEALRMLPSGHMTVADLGWVAPFGETIPPHPRVPEKLRGAAATGLHNRTFLALTLQQLRDAFPGCPRPVRAAITQLERAPDDVGVGQVLRDVELTRGGLPIAAVAGIAIAVLLAVIVAFQFVGGSGDDDDTGGSEIVDSTGGAPDTGAQGIKTPTDSSENGTDPTPAVVKVDREGPAEAQWTKIFGEDEEVSLPRFLGDGMKSQLEELRRNHPNTQAARRALFALRLAESVEIEAAWEWWTTLRAHAVEAIAAGKFARAAGHLDAPAPVPWLPEAIAAQRVALLERLARGVNALLGTTDETVQAYRKARDYEGAVECWRALLPQLPKGARAQVTSSIQALNVEKQLYSTSSEELQAARRRALSHAAAGAWPKAISAIPDMPPVFEELAANAASLVRLLKQAQQAAGKVDAVLQSAQLDRSKVAVETATDGEVKGTVLETKPVSFVVKLAGKTTTRELAWREQTVPSIAALGALSEADGCLLLAFLGELQLATLHARQMTPAPVWLPELEALADAARLERVQQLLAQCAELHDAARYNDLLPPVEELLDLLTAEEVTTQRGLLSRWLHAYWKTQGPGIAFTGATDPIWDADSSQLTLPYEFDDDASLADWGVGSRTLCEIKRRALIMQGSLTLTPRSMWLQPGGSLIFTKKLEVQLTAKADRKVPNVNVVLWSSRSTQRYSIIGGLGFQPPGRHSVKNPAGRVVLLPSNVLGQARLLERGNATTAAWLSIHPKVKSSTIDLVVSGVGTKYRLQWGAVDESVDLADSEANPRGSVELRSYGSRLWIRSVTVVGTVREAWFQAWRKLRIEEQLRR